MENFENRQTIFSQYKVPQSAAKFQFPNRYKFRDLYHFHFRDFFSSARKSFLPPGRQAKKNFPPLYPLCCSGSQVARPGKISGPNDKRWYQSYPAKHTKNANPYRISII